MPVADKDQGGLVPERGGFGSGAGERVDRADHDDRDDQGDQDDDQAQQAEQRQRAVAFGEGRESDDGHDDHDDETERALAGIEDDPDRAAAMTDVVADMREQAAAGDGVESGGLLERRGPDDDLVDKDDFGDPDDEPLDL